jgi:hypothetical protein
MPYTHSNKERDLMALFNKIFDARMLVRIIGALGIALVVKGVAAYFDFNWMVPFPHG